MIDEKVVETRPQVGKIAGVIRAEFQGSHGSEHAHVVNGRMISKIRQTLAMDPLDSGDSFKDRFGFENLQVRDRGGAAQWISGIGVAVEESAQAVLTVKGLIHFVTTDRYCQRQKASGQPFR